MIYSKKRAHEQTLAVSLKSRKVEPETVFTVDSTIEGTVQQNNRTLANDILVVTKNTGEQVNIPMREFLRMRTADGKKVVSNTEDAENISIPDRFKVVSSEDRKDQAGNTIYPIQAYKLGQKMLDGEISGAGAWAEVVAGGMKDGHKFEPVQNYTIAVL